MGVRSGPDAASGRAPYNGRPMDLFAAIGGTPLSRLRRIAAHLPHVELYAKAEFMNPGGSVKDRAARGMIRDGLARGLLKKGKTILEATSGNTGIANAMLGAALGFPVLLCVPGNIGLERREILAAYRAKLEETSPLEGTDGSRRRARELAAEDPEAFFYPDQYSNAANWKAHFETTGPEIWDQTGGRVTHFVAGLGTTGTFTGTSRFLKSRRADIACISAQPDAPLHGLEGMKHLASADVPAIHDPSLADEDLAIATEDAYAMTRRLAREEGLFVGVSSGANVVAALRVAESLPALHPAVVVTVLCDGGAKYLSERFWKEIP
jgi:cysteine synthase B